MSRARGAAERSRRGSKPKARSEAQPSGVSATASEARSEPEASEVNAVAASEARSEPQASEVDAVDAR